jgi:Ca2+-binding EF-hand superfamily protein
LFVLTRARAVVACGLGFADEEGLLAALGLDEASKEALAVIKDKAQMKSLWDQVDFNNNGIVSLAELDKLVVEKGWDISKPALMRAYKKTTLKDGDGDAWVERKEFAAFLRNMFFFDRLWDVFDDIDTGDDRRIDVGEFKAGMERLGSRLSDAEAQAEFAKIDRNGGGQILFKEFCHYVAGLVGASLEGDKEEFQEDADRHGKKAETGGASASSNKGGSKGKAAAASVPAKDGMSEYCFLCVRARARVCENACDMWVRCVFDVRVWCACLVTGLGFVCADKSACGCCLWLGFCRRGRAAGCAGA